MLPAVSVLEPGLEISSRLREADLIVVMDRGRVVETGSHEELLEKQGVYYGLYQTQFEGRAT